MDDRNRHPHDPAGVGCHPPDHGSVRFDWEHVERAVRAVELQDEAMARSVAGLPATAHLARHAIVFGGPPLAPADLTDRLLFPLTRHQTQVGRVRTALESARRQAASSGTWLGTVTRYLPGGWDDLAGATLYATFGYDIGVVSDGWSASVNLAHPLIAGAPGEFQFYAMHELHHAAYLRRHPPPDFTAIAHRDVLAAAVRYLTHLEGLGVYVPWAARRAADALDDPDYVALADEPRMSRLELRFRQLYAELEALPARVAPATVESVLQRFGAPDKLLHLVGCRLVSQFETLHGREALVATVTDGPERFFERCGLR